MAGARLVADPGPPSGAPHLVLRAIRKTFGAFTAVDGIDLAIDPGEFVCFLGPSGCGKTTLLRIIAGLEAQTSGQVLIGGRDVSALPPARRDYGIVFQSYALFPNLTVAANVGYGIDPHGISGTAIAARVEALLDQVGLPGSGARYPAQLSGGQQQRVALARALATSPGLLLLDEPLSALDAIVRVRLRNEIRKLQRRLGVTTVMVTHDQEEALSVADRIVVLNQGRIEQVGTPLAIYREPATPFVADFIGKVNRLSAVAAGDGSYRLGALRLRCPDGTGPSLAAGSPVAIYLRPEDGVVGAPAREHPDRIDGTVRRVEFLGATCLAEVSAAPIPDQPVLLQLSLNEADELAVREGGPLSFVMRADRLRVFPVAA